MSRKILSLTKGSIRNDRERTTISLKGFNPVGDYITCTVRKDKRGHVLTAALYTLNYSLPVKKFTLRLKHWDKESSLMPYENKKDTHGVIFVKGHNCTPQFEIAMFSEYDEEIYHITEDPRINFDVVGRDNDRLAEWGSINERDILGEKAYLKKWGGVEA